MGIDAYDDGYDEGWASAMVWAAKIVREANTDTSRKCLVDKLEKLSNKPLGFNAPTLTRVSRDGRVVMNPIESEH